MLRKDKTASSIKRKVQLAKQKVDKDYAETKATLASIMAWSDEIDDTVRKLEVELSDAQFAKEDAKADLSLANKVDGIAAGKKALVMDLIARFEVDLDDLLQ